MRYRIKARLADLGMKSKDLIEILNKDYGLKIDASKFSLAINSGSGTRKQELICETADRVLTEIENDRNLKNCY